MKNLHKMNNSYVHHFNYCQWRIHRGGGGGRAFKTNISTHYYCSLI